METAVGAQSTTDDVDRRAYVRVKLNTTITASRIAGGDAFTIEEASIAGFSVQSPVPFEPNSTHHFRLSDAGGQTVFVGGVCRYCRLLDGSEPPSYLVGFQLDSPPTRREPLVLGVFANDAPQGAPAAP